MKYAIILILLNINFAFAQFTNVQISNQNNPNEPAIIINPNNTSQIFAAANINNYYVSNDGGITWSINELNSPYGVWGDPCLALDNNNHLYFFHLSYLGTSDSWLDRIVCQKSTDGATTFNDGTFFGLHGNKDQDKEWATIDRNNGNIYAFWTEFDAYGSTSPTCETRLLFSKSTDASNTWSTPVTINTQNGNCVDEDNTVEGAVPSIGPNGEIYIAWAGPYGIRFNKSTDFGNTWLSNSILVDAQPNGWDFTIPGIQRANGMPITACDISGGLNNGTIYVNWSDQSNGSLDTDVWIKKSTDNGQTWSNAIKVNNDTTVSHQFFNWMTIDQTNGYIYVVFYDRRNYTDNQTDVYLARSTDGGNTFENFLISETPFVPNSAVFFGDYNNISAHNGIIRPIWTRLHNGNLSVWTALINNTQLSTYDFANAEEIQVNHYPNPVKDKAYISFKLRQAKKVTIILFDALGKQIANLISNQEYNYGNHIIPVDLKKLNLSNGNYFYSIKIGNSTQSKKLVIE